MALWEFAACVRAYSRKRAVDDRIRLATCWQTANFTGAAFGGKLRKFSRYLEDTERKRAPVVSREEFERRLKQAEEAKMHGN